MKVCTNTECPEDNPQPLSNFHNRQGTCKTCFNAKRRAERAEKAIDPHVKRTMAAEQKRKNTAVSETELFNSMNRR